MMPSRLLLASAFRQPRGAGAALANHCNRSRALQTCAAVLGTPQAAVLDRNMGRNQWYLHLSRQDGADMSTITGAIQSLRAACASQQIHLTVGFGPSLLQDVTKDLPQEFLPYETFKSVDGSGLEAKGTQEELLVWLNHDHKDAIWKAQYDFRKAVEGHMKVARETPTFIYGESLDMTGFTDGTGNPEPSEDVDVAIVPEGQGGAGGSFVIAQRWVHDLDRWNALPIDAQEGIFGRTKDHSVRLAEQPAHSHLSHVELREGETADATKPKRDQMSRRSTPYAFHDGTVGLYFMAFCKTQSPLVERMRAMYGMDGQVRDKLTEYSNPASGSFYFAPSVETLDAL